jgi:hypothetical protein
MRFNRVKFSLSRPNRPVLVSALLFLLCALLVSLGAVMLVPLLVSGLVLWHLAATGNQQDTLSREVG